MTDFRVWAPRATRMTLELDGQRHPMSAEADGWWSVTADGRDYGYLIDEAGTLDPRNKTIVDLETGAALNTVYSTRWPIAEASGVAGDPS